MQHLYTLIKHFWISCAHSVPGAGKCERIHGHNYKVIFSVSGTKLDNSQMLIDFREVKHKLEKKFDHQYLNDFPEFFDTPPSTEKVAEVFYSIIADLCESKENKPKVNWVEIHETHEAFARYEIIT